MEGVKCGTRNVMGDCSLLVFWVGAREAGMHGSPATLVSGCKTPDSALRGINTIYSVYQQFTQLL